MNQVVYPYSEDSALLGEAIFRAKSGETFLEIGFGNGGNLSKAANRFTLVVGTDIISPSKFPSNIPENSDVLCADRATCFRDAVFDLVAFNPPYLPSETIEDTTIDGGSTGVEIPLKFLDDALRVLKNGGKILVLLSSLGSTEKFSKFCSDHSVVSSKVGEKKLFFETLTVYLLSRA